jgi:hypothetical protein
VSRFALVELDPGLDLLGELGRVAKRDRDPISRDPTEIAIKRPVSGPQAIGKRGNGKRA